MVKLKKVTLVSAILLSGLVIILAVPAFARSGERGAGNYGNNIMGSAVSPLQGQRNGIGAGSAAGGVGYGMMNGYGPSIQKQGSNQGGTYGFSMMGR